MVDTVKFSEFANGGNLSNDVTTVGLASGVNTYFNNPWTFLPPGATGDRPTPSPSIYYLLRFNTTLQVYEYYDAITSTWTELSGNGTGTVNPGVANDLAFYAENGTIISPITTASNSVLITNSGSVPSLSTTLPSGISIPGATITSSTAALTSGSVAATPVSSNDIVNKSYADGLYSSSVHSITGTTNQVIASSPTGDVTLSLPQNIGTGSSPTFSALTLSNPLLPAYGGTGINNGSLTINLASATTGYVLTSDSSGNATWQAVSAGGAITTINGDSGSATPTSGVITISGGGIGLTTSGSSHTLSLTGTLAINHGGTNVTSVTTAPTASAFAGWDGNSNLSANNFLPNYATTATSAATTTLTVSSAYYQYFTGTTTQTVVMPVTSTLALGQSWYFVNNSTGNVTVQSSGANSIQVMAGGSSMLITCISTSGTTASSWNAQYFVDADVSGAVLLAPSGNQTITAHNLTLSTGAFQTLAGDISAGSSGSGHVVNVYPNTASSGILQLQSLASDGANNTGKIVLNTLGQATTYNLIDPSASSVNILTTGVAINSVPSITFSSTSGIIGTTTNNNAAAGSVGEELESIIASSSSVSLTNGTATTVTTLTLTAGDWDVWGNISYSFAASTTVTAVVSCIGFNTTGLTDPSLYTSFNYSAGTTPVLLGMTAPSRRISTTGITAYLTAFADFAVSTATACGGLYARRRR